MRRFSALLALGKRLAGSVGVGVARAALLPALLVALRGGLDFAFRDVPRNLLFLPVLEPFVRHLSGAAKRVLLQDLQRHVGALPEDARETLAAAEEQEVEQRDQEWAALIDFRALMERAATGKPTPATARTRKTAPRTSGHRTAGAATTAAKRRRVRAPDAAADADDAGGAGGLVSPALPPSAAAGASSTARKRAAPLSASAGARFAAAGALPTAASPAMKRKLRLGNISDSESEGGSEGEESAEEQGGDLRGGMLDAMLMSGSQAFTPSQRAAGSARKGRSTGKQAAKGSAAKVSAAKGSAAKGSAARGSAGSASRPAAAAATTTSSNKRRRSAVLMSDSEEAEAVSDFEDAEPPTAVQRPHKRARALRPGEALTSSGFVGMEESKGADDAAEASEDEPEVVEEDSQDMLASAWGDRRTLVRESPEADDMTSPSQQSLAPQSKRRTRRQYL